MTKPSVDRIKRTSPEQLPGMPDGSQPLILVSTGFAPGNKQRVLAPEHYQLTPEARSVINECARLLRAGGLLFVYGAPHELAFWGEHLAHLQDAPGPLVFKYWIALDIDDAEAKGALKPSHLGLLLFMKDRLGEKTPASFHPDTDAIRIPHAYCVACGQNVKDWGGKKHLMNPRGAAPSDVWRDLPRRPIRNGLIPDDVLERVLALAGAEGEACLHTVLRDCGSFQGTDESRPPALAKTISAASAWKNLDHVEADHVYLGDCVSFLTKTKSLHPEGVFDLAFADPPYNLEKSYDSYADALAEHHYHALHQSR